jgi:hypothetical protein
MPEYMREQQEGGGVELTEFVGKKIKIKDTERTRALGIAGGPGYVESVKNGKLQVIYTEKYYGPAGPFALDRDDVEIVE